MENCHVAKFMQIQQHKLRLFSVSDGLLGDIISFYLKKHLFANILNKEEFWGDPFRLMRKQIKQFFHKAQTWVVVDPLL
ncbi:hypothetical protein Godav_000842 [Gossypium davidsonii]|uniref:Uncharacterized protein n=2 Tax=Gossypium TaxID=3633 RepID=A0A7J8T1U4_GOSDV|nr:hypothetical protein [Gossypium davidsonii]MBA0667779.1 hypothetical protein [Gossypium klotzschianum]